MKRKKKAKPKSVVDLPAIDAWAATICRFCSANPQGARCRDCRARERRRYALLQAAAVLVRYNMSGNEEIEVEASVNDAELLLAEIEKREKEPQS